jgi:membrane protein YqaA with SNARE-associated domain
LKNLITKYTTLVWGLLEPLGPWGVLAVAAIDSAAFLVPLDPTVATFIFKTLKSLEASGVERNSLMWIFSLYLLYPLMASLGSALGSLVLYEVGRKGGELLLRKRVSKERFASIRDRFEKQEFIALMIPSMLPPPWPFKLFVLSAGVFHMKVRDFVIAIFVGRMIRFLILATLTVRFGPQIVEMAKNLLREHLGLTIIVAITTILLLYVIFRLLRKPVEELAHEMEKKD